MLQKVTSYIQHHWVMALVGGVAAILGSASLYAWTHIHPSPTSPHIVSSSEQKQVEVQAVAARGHFGFSLGNTLAHMDETELKAQLADMKSMGVEWVRYDIDWSEVQPNGPDSYWWGTSDRVVNAVNEAGLKSLVILSYAPHWAAIENCATDRCAPASDLAFASYAAEVVKRYSGQGIKYWEVWNEPNLKSFWGTTPDAAAYTRLLAASYGAIKVHDPQATVLSGGLADGDPREGNVPLLDYVTAMYQAGAKLSFDALSVHPYTYPHLASDATKFNGWQRLQRANNRSVRSIMADNLDQEKKIWFTEYGAPTGGSGPRVDVGMNVEHEHSIYVTEALQQQMLIDALTQYKQAQNTGPFFWYSYKDLGRDAADTESFFGVVRANGTQKPAYQEYKQQIADFKP